MSAWPVSLILKQFIPFLDIISANGQLVTQSVYQVRGPLQVASTDKAELRVTFCRSKNTCASVVFTLAPGSTDAGGAMIRTGLVVLTMLASKLPAPTAMKRATELNVSFFMILICSRILHTHMRRNTELMPKKKKEICVILLN